MIRIERAAEGHMLLEDITDPDKPLYEARLPGPGQSGLDHIYPDEGSRDLIGQGRTIYDAYKDLEEEARRRHGVDIPSVTILIADKLRQATMPKRK